MTDAPGTFNKECQVKPAYNLGSVNMKYKVQQNGRKQSYQPDTKTFILSVQHSSVLRLHLYFLCQCKSYYEPTTELQTRTHSLPILLL